MFGFVSAIKFKVGNEWLKIRDFSLKTLDQGKKLVITTS